MSIKKYYAVRKGKVPGIYRSWDACKKQIQGFSGAEYKGFTSLLEAENFMKPVENNSTASSVANTIVVYVDGSYSEERNLFSYSCIILDGKDTQLSGVSSDPSVLSMRNVAGELLGTEEAIKWAVNNRYDGILVCYDYEGIEKWANDTWSANKEGTKKYVQFIKEQRDKIQISFKKVKAHSGDKYNEIADGLAKQAIQNYTSLPNDVVNEQVLTSEIKLFKEIMSKKGNTTKSSVVVKVADYEITEAKLKKFAKSLWTSDNNSIKDIDNMIVNLDSNTNTVVCDILNLEGKSTKYIIRF